MSECAKLATLERAAFALFSDAAQKTWYAKEKLAERKSGRGADEGWKWFLLFVG